jgi:FkbM family methyltransferase
MKKLVQNLLQSVLGFRRYLFLFSLFKIRTLRRDKREGDFFHFLSLIPADAKVLDIGANIGIMTALLAKHCKQGEVHAIEPIPENFEALARICRHFGFGNVRLHQFALGAEEGTLEMVMPEVQKVKMQGLSHVVHESIPDFNEGKRYAVPQHTLDGLAEMVAGVKAIKIDVENFEYYVFAGAASTLRKYKPLIYCELWDNENRIKCFDLLSGELGYRIMVLEEGRLVKFDPGVHENQNFFFVA